MKVFLDVETTGLHLNEGHRVVELGLVKSDGNKAQWYFNPQREVSSESERIHGLTTDFLKDKPLFSKKAKDVLAFIQDCVLVAHNAAFDISFLNNELKLADCKPIENEVEDTLLMAQEKFPNDRHSLDALCKKFAIDLSGRDKHGALVDAQLLAELYPRLAAAVVEQTDILAVSTAPQRVKIEFKRRSFPPTHEELSTHRAFLAEFMKSHLWH